MEPLICTRRVTLRRSIFHGFPVSEGERFLGNSIWLQDVHPIRFRIQGLGFRAGMITTGGAGLCRGEEEGITMA